MKSKGQARAEAMITQSLTASDSLRLTSLLPPGWVPFLTAIILLILNVSMNGTLALLFISLSDAGTYGLALLVVAFSSVLLISTLGFIVMRGRPFGRQLMMGLSAVYALTALILTIIHLLSGSDEPAIYVIAGLSVASACAAGGLLSSAGARDLADFYAELWRFHRERRRRTAKIVAARHRQKKNI